MTASFQYDPQDPVTALKTRLLTRFNQLLSDHEQIWGKILEKKTVCAKIIDEQVQSNQHFTAFHNMYMEISVSWPDELQAYPRFLEMFDEVTQLSQWMSEFEPRSNLAMRTLTEIATIVTEKHAMLTELFPRINNSNDLSQINTINLDNFEWYDTNQYQMPNVQELEQEWKNEDVIHSVGLCVLELEQLFNTPVNVLVSDLPFMSENSSSPDSNNEEYAHNY